MTAPALAPAEQTEVDRFGIHDEDVIAWHDDQDEVLCNRGDAPAAVSLVMRCCGASYLVCERHLNIARRRCTTKDVRRCVTCHHVWAGCTFDQIYREVPL